MNTRKSFMFSLIALMFSLFAIGISESTPTTGNNTTIYYNNSTNQIHNNLSGLQGGNVGLDEFYHLNQTHHDIVETIPDCTGTNPPGSTSVLQFFGVSFACNYAPADDLTWQTQKLNKTGEYPSFIGNHYNATSSFVNTYPLFNNPAGFNQTALFVESKDNSALTGTDFLPVYNNPSTTGGLFYSLKTGALKWIGLDFLPGGSLMWRIGQAGDDNIHIQKISGTGLVEFTSTNVSISTMAGTGNAYVGVDSTGKLYRNARTTPYFIANSTHTCIHTNAATNLMAGFGVGYNGMRYTTASNSNGNIIVSLNYHKIAPATVSVLSSDTFVWGTGEAPLCNAVASGTVVGNTYVTYNPSALNNRFNSHETIAISGLSASTTYWFDIQSLSSSSAGWINSSPQITVYEP